jgi:hypothetical protein
VHERGSNGAKGELAGDGAWSWSEPVLLGPVEEVPPPPVVAVVAVVDETVEVVVPDVAVELEGATIAKSDPVTTATSAPAGVGAKAIVTAPVSDLETRSAAASTEGACESYSTSVSDSGPTGVVSPVEMTE